MKWSSNIHIFVILLSYISQWSCYVGEALLNSYLTKKNLQFSVLPYQSFRGVMARTPASTVDLSYVVVVKFTLDILQNFVAFSKYMNFIQEPHCHRASTGPEQGFPCVVNSHRVPLFSLQGFCIHYRDFLVRITTQGDACSYYREWVCSACM